MALIQCPKCGKQYSSHALQCPQCGLLQVDIPAFCKQQAEEKAKAEEERKRQEIERKAKKAEEAKLRQERRQEWWRRYHKYIYIGLGIVLCCCIIYILIYSITKVNERKEADVKALAELQIGDSLLSLSNYKEAITHYQSAMKYAQSDEVQRTCNLHNDSVQAIISLSISSLVQGCWCHGWGHSGFDYAYFYGNQCELNIPETGEDNVHAHYEIKGNTLVALDDQNHTIRQFLVKDSAIYIPIYGDRYSMCKITPNELLQCFQNFSMYDAAKKLMNIFHIQETKLVLNLKGNIGSATDGVLVFDEATDSGYYVYGLSGVAVKRSLKLESHNGDKLILTAYDKQGKYIGKFDGEYINGIFSGIFTNYKQVSISFKLHN
ncbi:MAG: zinc ribbon domain-containing protein [Paludibacteraceae bacterium]|nr:zinc ribbon domain-containing protein [Paludibacteraceae bacterium]